MSINPYQAPSAAVGDFMPPSDVDGELLDAPQRQPAGHGAEWFSAAWGLYRQAPWLWIGIVLVMGALFMAATLIPLAGGLVAASTFPLLWAGIMAGCDVQRRGKPLEFAHLFAGFSKRTGELLLAGVIYGVVLSLTMLIAYMPFFGLADAMMFVLGNPPQEWVESNDPTSFLMFLLATLIYLALALPAMMALWFAPALIILNGKPALTAFRLSFTACLRNILPFLIYGLLGLAFSIAASLPLFLGWLVLAPVLYISSYSAYRDIFFARA
jgi:uncharacterized membrane protein